MMLLQRGVGACLSLVTWYGVETSTLGARIDPGMFCQRCGGATDEQRQSLFATPHTACWTPLRDEAVTGRLTRGVMRKSLGLAEFAPRRPRLLPRS